jgi:hypothetical protein
MHGVLCLGNIDHGESDERPFLYVSQCEAVKCHLCGREVPAPGRIAIKLEDGDARYYCDCITEDQMQEVINEWNNYYVLSTMDDAPKGAGN